MTETRTRSESFRVRIRGDYACFTRPEMKVERVSYDVITPSAARGILEAVLWKPAIRWRVTRIDVLNPVRWTSVRRNEVSEVASIANAKKAMKSGTGALGVFIEDIRQQRAGLFLRDVDYIVHADFSLTDAAGEEDGIVKFEQMFRRRVEKGQCFHRPYLGCREFPAEVSFPAPEDGDLRPLPELTRDLGWMLLDLDYRGDAAQPRFFEARLKDGVLHVPDLEAEEVRG